MKKVQIIEKSCHREGLKVERMRDFFRANNYELVNDDTGLDPTNKYAFPLENLVIHPDADIIVLTTCGFSKAIEDGDFEALKIINENKKPSAQVIVGGCVNEIAKERLAKEFHGPTFNAKSYHKLNDFIEHSVDFNDIPKVNRLKNTDNFFIKIQDGCNHRCSYCAIWKAAGKSVSKPIDAVITEFKNGLKNGYKHFYFLGECLGSYGLDFGSSLGELLRQFRTIDGDYDILIEDVHPVYFLKCFEDIKELCKMGKIRSFHTPIQSGSNRILKLMNRQCDMEKIKKYLLELREACPEMTLSSAVIVGFPTETKEELEETINYCKEATFDTVACHMFSARPGAVAAEMDGQISEEEKAERYHIFKSNFTGKTRVDPNQRKYVGE
ncbi:radical SAM protein [Clostridium sp. DJ247]|uniref:radical SAM protein n=1 Tax=Clostridium sp. DJ247 TaxID=2726188 RepID=UPI001626295F|nr:radical SAM protein [Clostridium sp. DJ247]MBC2581085.1 radical SAM protein [Clostridium sp. DJ247]